MSCLIKDVQDRLETALASSGVSGASFALWDGEALHTAVAGVRNSVTRDPVTVDTLMHIGSITKIVNATLVMQLVDDGLIKLDDPVLHHLPDLRVGDMAALEQITVQMLLNHTNGINCIVLPDQGPDKERIVDAIDRFASATQLHPPGEGPSYSNAGVVISGYLAERLRGESWYELVKKRILLPLGLDHSLVDLTDLPRFRVSVGDLTDPATGQTFQTSRPFLLLSFAPAGATMMMSASDLVNFGRAHLNGGVGANGTRVLTEASTALMQRPTSDVIEPKGWQWGIGWTVLSGGLLFHGGGGPGVASMLYLHPESGRAVALLTNTDSGFGIHSEILGPILSNWSGQDWSNGLYPKPEVSLPPGYRLSEVERHAYCGAYTNNMFNIEIVELEDGIGLRFHNSAQIYDNLLTEPPAASPMTPIGEHAFTFTHAGFPGTMVRFISPDASGRSPGVGFHVHVLTRVT